MPPAARVGDQHACPAGSGSPHVGGPVSAPGSATVFIGGQPAARAGDHAQCAGPPDLIVQGSATVFIDGRPAARVGDKCGHAGVIVTGCPTVIIGDQPGGASGTAPSVPGTGRRRRLPGVGGGTAPGVPGAGTPPGPGGGFGKAVPKAPPPQTKTPKDPSASKDAGTKEKDDENADDGEKKPTLFGSPATMELMRAVARLAQQMIPGLANRVPPVDPQMMQATIAELREAIARKDVDAINAISARLTAMMQPAASPGTAPSAGGESSAAASSSSPWTIPGQT
jgi:uncharacterized Zn-binding protein involved in type VI secretion